MRVRLPPWGPILNTGMKIEDIILLEYPVGSSWIKDLDFDEDSGIVTMELLNGAAYRFGGIDFATFNKWLSASSKGKFWHRAVKHVI